MPFPCEWCGQDHPDVVQVKHGAGVVEYGTECMQEMARSIDALNLGTVQVELRRDLDPFRHKLLELRRDAITAPRRARR